MCHASHLDVLLSVRCVAWRCTHLSGAGCILAMKLYSVFPVPFTDSVRPATLLYPVTSVHRSHECAPQPRVRTAARTTVTYTSGLGEVGAEHLRRCHKFEACWHRQTIWLWSCSHQAAFQMVHAVEHLRLNGCCDDGSRNCMHKSPGRPGGGLYVW